ncbi:MAG: glycosyltransferase family 2 protein [Methyloprofundus sp.]|nr:glycosyltransferase family 2 protein [Methyloprofundus sp.]
MVNKSLVSIIIPTYNSGEYLKETVESCVNQTYKDLEIIVVDDCSTDGTIKYLRSLDNIKVFERDENQGISRNVNFGVKNAAGKYILLLGHDDILPCKHIELMMKEFEQDTGLVHCNALKIDADGKILNLARKPSEQLKKNKKALQQLSVDNFISSCGLIFKKDIFLSFGGWDEKYKLYGEWLSYIKFLQISEIKFCQTSHAYYRVHKKSTMKMINKDQKLAISDYKKTCRDLAYDCLKNDEKNLLLNLKRGLRVAKENFNN